MSEVVERVAIAIGKKVWPALHGGSPVALRDIARAAISAMREPTDEMIDHFGDWMGDKPEHHEIARDLWREAIDEALA